MWIPFALVDALGGSVMSNINKHQVQKSHPVVNLFFNQCASVVCMLFAIMLLGGIPQVTPLFFLFMFCSSILDAVAFISAYWAIRQTEISLLSPLGSLTPVFATIFGAIFLHEIPTPLKLLGIVTIVCGVYLLNIADVKGGFFRPFKKLFSDAGVKLYFIEVILFGITPIFQKQAIFQIHGNMPLFAPFIGNLFVLLYLLPYVVKKLSKKQQGSIKGKRYFIAFGVINTFTQLAAYTVFSMTHVGYATAIFSLSSLFTIISAGLLFKEKRIKERLFGASVMILGTLLLAI